MKTIRVADAQRETSNIITKYELANVISVRTSQIEAGSPALIDTELLTSAREIAMQELRERKNPMIVVRISRETADAIYEEHWRVREMSYAGHELV